jgi:hypothetical protein
MNSKAGPHYIADHMCSKDAVQQHCCMHDSIPNNLNSDYTRVTPKNNNSGNP